MMKNQSNKIVLIFLIVLALPLHSEIRYVSKTGSAQPPYTSWATASDSIQKCINISSFGDTIYVGNGVYKEQIAMIPGLSLIGSGMDSCVIDTRELVQPSSFYAVTISDTTLLRGFKIIVSEIYSVNDYWGFGIKDPRKIKNVRIEFNYIDQVGTGIKISRDSDSIIIRKNIITNSITGLNLSSVFGPSRYFVEDNYIEAIDIGIYVSFGGDPITEIRNNIILINKDGEAIFRWNTAPITIENNIVIKSETTNDWRFGINISRASGVIKNNVIVGKFGQGIVGLDYNKIINNVVMNSRYGIEKGENNNPLIKYNNMWDNLINNYQGFTPDSTNLSVNPMFTDEDSLNFYLQMYSPLIDAGDPEILDRDGSRSDIGLFGGPYGEKYTYMDLAPKPPRNITGAYEEKQIVLKWNKNTEVDFKNYRIYRDTVTGFIYDSTKLVGETTDSLFRENLPYRNSETKYYYLVTAIDSTGNQSAPGEEVTITITGNAEFPPLVLEEYKLLNNYPNPFNPRTIIPYRLKEGGYVKLYIYDIKGEIVEVLVNGWQD
ncbi:MAG: right-handed parallel beta-helix repeat-containing protein, partial [Ignavibacteria bacterium]|nr:right-handed parallel beta-helix repeat-containing protein [Ignavibacteria bacterium]